MFVFVIELKVSGYVYKSKSFVVFFYPFLCPDCCDSSSYTFWSLSRFVNSTKAMVKLPSGMIESMNVFVDWPSHFINSTKAMVKLPSGTLESMNVFVDWLSHFINSTKVMVKLPSGMLESMNVFVD